MISDTLGLNPHHNQNVPIQSDWELKVVPEFVSLARNAEVFVGVNFYSDFYF